MSVRIALAAAIKTGQFGPLRLGMPKAAVRQELGDPDDEMTPGRRERESPGWKYGDIELLFAPPDYTLSCVHMDNFDTLDGGVRLAIDRGGIRGGMSWVELLAWLERHAVACHEVEAPSPGDRWMRTAGGVTFGVVVVADEFGPSEGLWAISWS